MTIDFSNTQLIEEKPIESCLAQVRVEELFLSAYFMDQMVEILSTDFSSSDGL